jgi:alkanesulfonate monooxygenase SsuD/methylene tetrahydromethanopterin reductase-like flavin-dependent oxidoreductase (luciferase family)
MRFDVFFSLSQTPVDGASPSEARMFQNFFDQVEAADELGYDTAWLAEAHLSSEVQKGNAQPVIPHWEGEVGLMTDFGQVAARIFQRTKRIECGSAIMNILCNGGPIAAAERIAAFANLHGLDPDEKRRVHIGFAGGRFEYQNRPYGIVPRTPLEEAAWPGLKGQIFREGAEIFCRLLRGDVLSADDIAPTVLTRAHFRTDDAWQACQEAAGTDAAEVPIPRRFDFEELRIIPKDWRRELVQLVVGSHDPSIPPALNQILPVQVFNLSITQPAIIEATHERMAATYHPDGGPWHRHYMPRTTFVFINAQPHLSAEEQRAAAHEEATAALGEYWKALEGTIDPARITKAANNALIGNPADIVAQAKERFHGDDRLMLWFDFFNHDSPRVIENMEAFMTQVAPELKGEGA